jgi:cell division protein FtsB
VSISFKVAVRRFQHRFVRKRSIGWTVFWVYLGILAISSVFSDRGLMTVCRLRAERERLSREISAISAEVSGLQREVRELQTDPLALERYARKELHLVGPNEIQYIFQ